MGRTLALAAMCLAVAAFHRAVAPDTFREVAAEKPAAVKYRNAEPGVEYVGDQVCGSCHAVQYKNFKQTAMGRSASVPSGEDLASLSKPVNFSS